MWKFYAILSAFLLQLWQSWPKSASRDLWKPCNCNKDHCNSFIAWGIVLATGDIRELKTLTRNNLLFPGLSGIATGLSWIFYFKALETGDLAQVAPIDKLSAAIALGLAFLILKEPIEAKTLIGAPLIVSGAIVIIL
ncbi:EamA family transporter [Pedobacter chinensis]|uniref:EamA family transporter n=1 Tax=Pedobacter chinensis TaxID=2282421 RepID=UPI0021D2D8CF|nr:EamA family transporter [Pedobacter chinensis]